VESDEPFASNGKGYEWTQTLDVKAGRDAVLELTAANAEVGAAPPPSAAAAPKDTAPALLEWKDSLVSVWTPTARGSGFVVDTSAGLVVTSQRPIGTATAVEVQLTPSVKVAARILAADRDRDIAVLWIDPGTAASVRPAPLTCEARADVRLESGRDSHLAAVADVCDVVAAAKKAMQTAPKPVAAHLPVEPPQAISVAALDTAVKLRAGNLNPYQMSSSDFDVAFLTPVLIRGANPAMDFGGWSDYLADAPPVLVIRVTPKLAEGFWTTVARGAAYTQGVALPPIKHFKPGFSRLRVLCGEVEVTPIHPFTLEQRVSETDAIREGLYIFDPRTLGTQCTSVKVVLYSEKEPGKPDTRTVDPHVIERIRDDFAQLQR